jgi:hypothetical protein
MLCVVQTVQLAVVDLSEIEIERLFGTRWVVQSRP